MNELQGVSLPLTTAQRGLWVGEKIAAADATMNIAELIEISGAIDPQLFLRALRQLTSEAETLRICVVERDGRPFQIVRPAYEGEFPYLDVSAEPDPRAAAEAWARAELNRPVDLANDWLWVSALFKAAEDRYYWYQRAHHVAYDGHSGGMIVRRQAELYTAYVEGREPAPSGFGSLASLVEAESAYRGSDRFRRDREYWHQQLAGLPEAVTLSRSTRRHSMGGLRHSIGYLPVETAQRLAELGKAAGASLPQVLIGLVAAYYHRATGTNDLVMGMPVSGRINAALRGVPGMVANAVSIRLAFAPGMAAAELFAQVSKVVRQALRHQQYRYEDLRRDLGLIGQGQHIAWLGVNIEPFDYQLKFGEASATSYNLSNGSAEDLTIFIFDRGNGHPLCIQLDANPAMYSMEELDEHRRRLVRLIEGVLAAPERPLKQIDILGEAERERLLRGWNATAAELSYASVPALLARQAQRQPEAPAVVYEGSELSYRQLHERSVRQARQLLADGVKPGDIVAVALPRNEQLLVVLLAIMRTGAAYLPIDPEGPAERVAAVLEDARPSAMITQPELCGRFSRGGMLLLTPEERGEISATVPAEPDYAAPESTAYVLFTSGSTGRPKGVAVSHRNLHNFLEGMQRELEPTADARFLAVTTILFDIAGLELYLPLRVGARVVMASNEAVRQPPVLARLIRQSGASHVQATPSLWRILLASAETRLEGVHAMVGGEALSAELAAKLRRASARLTQFYGPTETTVWSTAYSVDGVGTEAPPIGRPILNTQLYVLDEEREPVMTGAIGELYIGGEGVAQGYLHRPELTAERFPQDPFAADGRRMYRTGDLVRWREDGVLEFIGRADDQVKIRGHRIELGEVETQLARHPAVAEAAVAVHRDAEGVASLAGYVVARPESSLELDGLRSHLFAHLPDYMIPTSLQVLESLPLTANGKLDRKALPAPERSSGSAYAEPVTVVEKKLASLWQEIFGLERVGLHDNFFELGGDSLTAAEMIARFPDYFAVELPLGSLFEASTIAGLAAYLQRAVESSGDPLHTVLPLREVRHERPLFCIHPVSGLSWGYTSLLRHLDARLPVYGLQSRGLRGDAELPASVEDIAADYLAQIRQIQPEGPYRLLGWSLGGLISHAITAQLQAQGQKVELLAILDAYPFVTDPSQPRGDEASEARAVLNFLGFHHLARHNPPRDMGELADLLCREYDVLSIPLVQELMKNEPGLIDQVARVTRNNLELARNFVPERIEADVVYFNAAVKEDADLDGILHYHPSAWRPYVSGRFEVHDVDCGHQAMLDEAPVEHIGRVLRQKLDNLGEARPAPRSVPATEPSREAAGIMPVYA